MESLFLFYIDEDLDVSLNDKLNIYNKKLCRLDAMLNVIEKELHKIRYFPDSKNQYTYENDKFVFISGNEKYFDGIQQKDKELSYLSKKLIIQINELKLKINNESGFPQKTHI